MADLIRVWLLPDVGGRVAIQANTRPFDDPRWEECIAIPRADYDALLARAEKAEWERDEARETNRRLNRRCQRSEALPKFHELGLADELRSAVWHLRYRYRRAASAARSIERMWTDNSASHYANLIREWAGKGRPPNHTLSHFDSIVDEMRADKAALAAATSRAEKAEKERDEAATAAKVKADLLATATAALGDATARAERAEAKLRDARAAKGGA